MTADGTYVIIKTTGEPVYDFEENGIAVASAMWDAYHGHTHAITDYPIDICHYHITDADTRSGSGYYAHQALLSNSIFLALIIGFLGCDSNRPVAHSFALLDRNEQQITINKGLHEICSRKV
jgi:hypothetical protein